MSPVAAVEPLDVGTLPLWEDQDSPRERSPEPDRSPALGPASGGGTLGSALDAAWASLEAGFTAACLLCGGTVHPRWSAGAGVVGGRCERCGTGLE